MIEVGEKSKITVHWKTNPYDFSEEKKSELISKIAKKYKISKESVRVVPDFIMLNSKGENMNIANDLILNIQNPEFQVKLFKEYLDLNSIENYDFDFIKKIDNEINASMNYGLYEKYRRYSIKWLRWDNFLSYGKENYFDFTNLHDLVLLNGEPANQSGKTTFAIDLLHFLLFGKTDKASTQDKIFNKYLKEETEVIVEGCLNIEGEDYIIKRTLSRPQYKKRTSKSKVGQKVQYYRIINNVAEELEEYIDNQQEENSIKTNKIIKEAIGNENDFDLIISATNTNLDELIEKKDTERGRILSRWIGLLPLEEKERIAKEKFNGSIKPSLLSNKFNIETLTEQKDAFTLDIQHSQEEAQRYEKENLKIEKEIQNIEENQRILLSSRQVIDETLNKIDITTLNARLETLKQDGIKKKNEIDNLKVEIDKIGDITDFSEDYYEKLSKEKIEIVSQLATERNEYKHISNQITNLEKGEYCPTCGKKLDNVDNTEQIKKLQLQLEEIKKRGVTINSRIEEITTLLENMNTSRNNFLTKSKLLIQVSACEVQLEQLRNDYRENQLTLKEYNSNKEAIQKNNEIDLKIQNYAFSLLNYRNTKEQNIKYIEKYTNQINYNKHSIEEIDKIIKVINEETKLIYHWKLYLELVGKNGVSKMVLRQALPIINAQIAHLLSDICDFNVMIEIGDKNEINFNLIKDDIVSDISSGSGFEKTAVALALRFVLAKNSVLPKMSYLILDEIFGRVAQENYDNMKTLIDRVKEDYSCIIIVSHLEQIKEWCSQCITVNKTPEGISQIKLVNQK